MAAFTSHALACRTAWRQPEEDSDTAGRSEHPTRPITGGVGCFEGQWQAAAARWWRRRGSEWYSATCGLRPMRTARILADSPASAACSSIDELAAVARLVASVAAGEWRAQRRLVGDSGMDGMRRLVGRSSAHVERSEAAGSMSWASRWWTRQRCEDTGGAGGHSWPPRSTGEGAC